MVDGAGSSRGVLDALEQRLGEPSARSLAQAVGAALREGALAPGDRLPPIRTVATELGLSPTTVSTAWSRLLRAGVISTDGRRGTRIADRPRAGGAARYRAALARGGDYSLDLSTGVPDPALLPDLAHALGSLREARPPGSYLDDPVLPRLGEILRDDWPCPVDEITVVDGAMDGVELALRVLVGFGDRVAVEHPAFPPILDLLEALGAEVVGVPVDAEGMSAETLAAAGPVRVVLLQPRAQNPTGVSLTPRRAERLAAVAARLQAVVIEDDSAGAVSSVPALSLGRWYGRTVHIRSFAKSHGPDLRLAALGAPGDVVEQITALRRLGQGWSSRLLQQLLAALLTDPVAVAAVERARDAYAGRRAAMVTALAARGIEVGGSDGLNIWLPVADETAAVVRLARQGIGVAPGAPFAAVPSPAPHVRVTVGLLAGGQATVAEALAAASRDSLRSPV